MRPGDFFFRIYLCLSIKAFPDGVMLHSRVLPPLRYSILDKYPDFFIPLKASDTPFMYIPVSSDTNLDVQLGFFSTADSSNIFFLSVVDSSGVGRAATARCNMVICSSNRFILGF